LILSVIIGGFGFAALFTLFLFATALAETQRFPFHCVVVTEAGPTVSQLGRYEDTHEKVHQLACCIRSGPRRGRGHSRGRCRSAALSGQPLFL
jgi:hypothetical protein